MVGDLGSLGGGMVTSCSSDMVALDACGVTGDGIGPLVNLTQDGGDTDLSDCLDVDCVLLESLSGFLAIRFRKLEGLLDLLTSGISGS